MYSFPNLEPVCCSISSSKSCFLTCIQISQEADQMVWYYHLFQNFPQFIVIHTVKGFGIVNKAEIDVFLELSCFFDDPVYVGNLISGSSWKSGSSQFTYCWSLALTVHEPELPEVQSGFRKGERTRDQIANIHWIIKKAREFQKNIYFWFIDYAKAFDFGSQ